MTERRPLSNLRYERIQDDSSSPRLITLHDHNQAGAAGSELARAVLPSGRIIGLESYKGVYVGREITGFTWYPGPIDQPPPVFFGDSLIEIEKFLWDELNRQEADPPERPYLIGARQGAVMALAAALAAPDLLSGIIAIDGMLPRVPGWAPPLAPLDSLPVMLVGEYPREHIRSDVLAGEPLARQLERWGGTVTQCSPEPGDATTDAIRNWLNQQTARFGAPAGDDT